MMALVPNRKQWADDKFGTQMGKNGLMMALMIMYLKQPLFYSEKL